MVEVYFSFPFLFFSVVVSMNFPLSLTVANCKPVEQLENGKSCIDMCFAISIVKTRRNSSNAIFSMSMSLSF